MHVTSLPGAMGSGDLSAEAFEFVDRLAEAKQTWWQMLPVGPPSAPPGNSPYSSPSAFAGSPFLISPERLVEDGLLDRADLKGARAAPGGRADRVNFRRVRAVRWALLKRAYENFASAPRAERRRFEAYCEREAGWLADDALYGALKGAFDERPWFEWPRALRDREPSAIAGIRQRLAGAIEFHSFLQYLFDRQWRALRDHARARGVGLIGDMPIFVDHDSVPVWVQPDLWQLDRQRRPKLVSGTPPDAFCADGQHWGHPIYDWAAHERESFAWWVQRLAGAFERFDGLRIDHFLGMVRMWAIPAGASTAANGKWAKVPGEALLKAIETALGKLPIIAEDLGLLTPEASALRDQFALPGMRVLQFGFVDPQGHGEYHRPYAYPLSSVAYTGTHDNDTIAGFLKSLPANLRRRVLAYAGSDGRAPHWDLIRGVMASPANTAVFPMQDLLGLDARSRFNTPGRAEGNWGWRLRDGEFAAAVVKRLKALTEMYDRGSD
jgi:4-alpha-glucanotransferase